ncbi:MAG: Glycine/sarcosine N-methyltransferase [Firmicutes bacterium ADurb.Bin248]|nr:MAG: Glycine/sarcosine N-methyltransferase [Firmicutes bacterium ADurb.Bin248]
MHESETVKSYYDNAPEAEWKRLEGFRFEFEITSRMMARFVKPGARILDIGGGPGRYSLYFAARGHDVTLVDLSDGNVAFAKNKAAELGLALRAYQCDARDLSRLELENGYDCVLVMGPLYHLFEEGERERVIREAKSRLAPDGVLFASFITLYGGLNYYLSDCPEQIVHESAMDFFERMAEEKTWHGKAFTLANFVDCGEIEPFFARLGFEKLCLFGQEGVTATRLTDIERAPEEVRRFYLDLSLKLCDKRAYAAYSSHMMYVGRKLTDDQW